mgnify:CR=1 FL=1
MEPDGGAGQSGDDATATGGLSGYDFETYHASCIAEWVALLEVWPEDEMATIEQYEDRIARDEAQIRFYRGMAATAIKPENRASYAASADSLEALTARHRAALAALRGDGVGQMPLFGEAAA